MNSCTDITPSRASSGKGVERCAPAEPVGLTHTIRDSIVKRRTKVSTRTARADMERLSCSVPAIHTHLETLCDAIEGHDEATAQKAAVSLRGALGQGAALLAKLELLCDRMGEI